jgi:hypothetical protein
MKVRDSLLISLKVSCDPKCSTAREHLIDPLNVGFIILPSLKVSCHQDDPKCSSTAGEYLGDPMKFKNIFLTALKVSCHQGDQLKYSWMMLD